MPTEGDGWTIPQEEIDKWRDLRDVCVCSIDPPGCKDIDDALHCYWMPNGNFNVGVHIADVTHFVKPDSELDWEAARRCTTVYLVDRRTDMLPGLLTENLCSLRDDGPWLAFSVIWEIDSKTYKVVKTEYCKSVIKSKASLTYRKAQDIHDDSKDNSELALGIWGLMQIAWVLRDKRIESGALTLGSPEVKFDMDE